MRYLIRAGLGLLAVLVLAIVAVTLFLATFDPNAHKEAIAARVKAATGRELTLEGPIEWGLWPELRLKLGPLALGNAAGFGPDPMLRLSELQIAVATWPLLSGRVELDTVVLHGADVRLARNADGVTNWADLARPAAPAERRPGRGGSGAAVLLLGGVDITDARIAWHDEAAGRDLTLDALNVHSDPLTFGDPVVLKLASKLTSTQPELQGDVTLDGTITYDLETDRYAIAPLAAAATLRGGTLPGGKAELTTSAEVALDLAAGTAAVTKLKLDALGNSLTGDLKLDRLKAARPGGQGTLHVTGKDLAPLFRAFALPGATQVAALPDRSFEFTTQFDANMDSGILSVPQLNLKLLGARLEGQLDGQRANTETPAFKGRLKARGADLPALLVVASQFRGADAQAGRDLAKALSRVKDKAFALDTEFDADLASERIQVPKLSAQMLGNDLTGSLTAQEGSGGKPALRGALSASGADLSSVVLALAGLQGSSSDAMAALASVLGKRSDRSFKIATEIDADLGADRVALPTLTADLFGNQLNGTLTATRATSGEPAVQAEFAANGTDLPALLAIGGGLQGGSGGLASLAESLATAPDKAFSFKARIEADLKDGRAVIPTLTASSLGLTLDGKLEAKDMKQAGAIDGHLSLKGTALTPLLTALGQADLAPAVRSIAFDAGVKGTRENLALTPFKATASITGGTGAAPVDLQLGVGSATANLAQETLSVKDLTLTGLGINLKGALEATKIKSAPSYTGRIDVPAFNLRQTLASLNKPVTGMADPQALTQVGLVAALQGTAKTLGVQDLVVKLDETTLKGNVTINDFGGPDLGFKLAIDRLNADRYLAPAGADKAKPVTPEAAAVGAAQLPLETLRKLTLNGDLTLTELQISGARLANVALNVSGRGGKLALNPVTADLYQGKYTGAVALDASGKQPALAINSALAKVAIEPLLGDVTGKRDLSGTVNFEAKLTAVGADAPAIKRSLTGPASFAIQNGELRGIDIPAVLHAAELIVESKQLQPVPTGGSTRFQSLTGSLDIQNGVVMNKDLLLDGLGFKVTGEGMLANLDTMKIKYDAKIAVDQGRVEQGAETYNLGNYTIPIRCRGELSGTSCLPDLAELAKEAAIKAAKDKAQEQLDKSLDGAGKALKNLLKF